MLSLHLEIARVELVTLVLAEERAVAVLPCGLQGALHEVWGMAEPAGLADVRLALLHHLQALVGV